MFSTLFSLTPFGQLLSAIVGCAIAAGCVQMPSAATNSISVHATASSTSDYTVTTNVNGRSTTQIVHAPYGLKSSVILQSDDGIATSQASTTPLTETDVTHMEQDMSDVQKQMDQIFADEQKVFDQMFANF
jgi:hypothetical protein